MTPAPADMDALRDATIPDVLKFLATVEHPDAPARDIAEWRPVLDGHDPEQICKAVFLLVGSAPGPMSPAGVLAAIGRLSAAAADVRELARPRHTSRTDVALWIDCAYCGAPAGQLCGIPGKLHRYRLARGAHHLRGIRAIFDESIRAERDAFWAGVQRRVALKWPDINARYPWLADLPSAVAE